MLLGKAFISILVVRFKFYMDKVAINIIDALRAPRTWYYKIHALNFSSNKPLMRYHFGLHLHRITFSRLSENLFLALRE